MPSTAISVSQDRIEFRFSDLDATEDDLRHRAEDLVPLLTALLEADAAFNRATDTEKEHRIAGFLSLNLMCKALIDQARQKGRNLEMIASGGAQPGEFGFPEFAPETADPG